MPGTLNDRDWTILLRRVESGDCTPFLGAGACAGTLPLGGQVAKEWAEAHNYPRRDETDLVKIAQFLAVQYDPTFPKDEILRRLSGHAPPEFGKDGEPHGVLADLPLPVYLTTNYDDYMVQALRGARKNPVRELCVWNGLIQNRSSIFKERPDYDPDYLNPLVYHLHGHLGDKHSIIITEDDYLDFLVKLGKDENQMLPPRIKRAICGSSLLFIGYTLNDWTFKVLFRGLVAGLEGSGRSVSVTVQLPPSESGYQEYLDEYFGKISMRVYWGTARDFCAQLHQKWLQSRGATNGR